MQYTNTQHPSNTRTTVTMVMSIIFGVSIIPTTITKATPDSPNQNTLSYTISDPDLTFSGTGLKVGDKVRILPQGKVAQGGLCPRSTATKFPNSEYEAEVTAPEGPESDGTISFTIKPEHVPLATGQVCYSRVDSPNVWTPVFQSSKNAGLYFSLENTYVPTLYQEVSIKIRKGKTDVAPVAPVFEATDKFYFIEKKTICKDRLTTCVAATKMCKAGPDIVTVWGVVPATDKNTAMATVIIKDGEFTIGKTYKMCYIKENRGTISGSPGSKKGPKVYEASSTLTSEKDTPVSFTILSSIYTTPVMTPATVYAGQGDVTLTIAAKPVTGTAIGNKEIKKLPFLIPCPSAACSVKDKDTMAALCSLTTNTGTVTTGEVTGFGTVKLTTSFTAPVTPAASYGICVPYCFKTGKCETALSWALVNSDTPIKFPAKSDKDGNPDTKHITVPPKPEVSIVPSVPGNKTTTLSATAISSTIPAVLITSVVFLYLYK